MNCEKKFNCGAACRGEHVSITAIAPCRIAMTSAPALTRVSRVAPDPVSRAENYRAAGNERKDGTVTDEPKIALFARLKDWSSLLTALSLSLSLYHISRVATSHARGAVSPDTCQTSTGPELTPHTHTHTHTATTLRRNRPYTNVSVSSNRPTHIHRATGAGSSSSPPPPSALSSGATVPVLTRGLANARAHFCAPGMMCWYAVSPLPATPSLPACLTSAPSASNFIEAR